MRCICVLFCWNLLSLFKLVYCLFQQKEKEEEEKKAKEEEEEKEKEKKDAAQKKEVSVFFVLKANRPTTAN